MFNVYVVGSTNKVAPVQETMDLEAAVLLTSAYGWEEEAPDLYETVFFIRKVTAQGTRHVVATGRYIPHPHGLDRPWLQWSLPHGVQRLFQAKDSERRAYEVYEVK
jgi:hypothetical protein